MSEGYLLILGVVAALACALVGYIYVDGWITRRMVDRVFAGRVERTSRQFYEDFFASDGVPFELVDAVRSILGEHLPLDISRVHPADDFTENLDFIWKRTSDLADVDIVEALEEKFGIKISDREAADAKTVRQVVELVARKT